MKIKKEAVEKNPKSQREKQAIDTFLMRHIFSFFGAAGIVLFGVLGYILYERVSAEFVDENLVESTVIISPPAILNLSKYEQVISFHQHKLLEGADNIARDVYDPFQPLDAVEEVPVNKKPSVDEDIRTVLDPFSGI